VGHATPQGKVEDIPSELRATAALRGDLQIAPADLVGVLPLAVGSHRRKLLPNCVHFQTAWSCLDEAGFEEKSK
jgi:hypothetical protein